ncbi:cytidine deaminase [Hasllibacter sp. MH4015]|uniref:cytidine deaminase n=1 Tax=Hasllibacter sp. MH4015 TaxID=2854029 RepID=UPI002103684E|nr:cytidine deaminase [Hasllibacter sp. MH4015]
MAEQIALIDEAARVRENAHAPYSKFKVGCALRSTDGNLHVGCNVENVAYPEGTCAEAGAIAAMIAQGDTRITEIAVIADSPTPVPPCGGCRQKLAEFADGDVVVTLATTAGLSERTSVAALLPGSFDAGHMAKVT